MITYLCSVGIGGRGGGGGAHRSSHALVRLIYCRLVIQDGALTSKVTNLPYTKRDPLRKPGDALGQLPVYGFWSAVGKTEGCSRETGELARGALENRGYDDP